MSDIARGMLAFYMERAGYYYGVEGKNEHPGFDEYWERHGERAFCLSWFAVKLDRATGGISPLAYGAELRAHEVRRQVDELPPVDREVVLLGLFAAKTDLRDVVSEQDLVFAGRRLGAERLLQLLRGEPVIDDPDLPHYRDRIRDLVLQHSAELLRPADGPWLIEQGRTMRKADWFRAAADLRPESASVILREAFQTCDFLGDGRARTATALWRLAGQENEDFLVEWFFGDEAPKVGRAPYRAGFIDFLTERFQVIDRCLLARFVRDTRFEQLDWQTLESLMNGLNRNLLHPVVPADEIAGTGHPLGKASFHGMIARAREQYPRETARLLTTLDRWRERVRARVKDWELPPLQHRCRIGSH